MHVNFISKQLFSEQFANNLRRIRFSLYRNSLFNLNQIFNMVSFFEVHLIQHILTHCKSFFKKQKDYGAPSFLLEYLFLINKHIQAIPSVPQHGYSTGTLIPSTTPSYSIFRPKSIIYDSRNIFNHLSDELKFRNFFSWKTDHPRI